MLAQNNNFEYAPNQVRSFLHSHEGVEHFGERVLPLVRELHSHQSEFEPVPAHAWPPAPAFTTTRSPASAARSAAHVLTGELPQRTRYF